MNATGALALLLTIVLVAVTVSGSHSPAGLESCTPSGHGDCVEDEPVKDFSPRWPHPAAACSEPYHVQWAGWDLCWQQDDVRVQGLEINRAFFHNGSVAWRMGVPFSLTRYEEPLSGFGPYKDVLGLPSARGLPGFGEGALPLTQESCSRFFGNGHLLHDDRVCVEYREGIEPAVAVWGRYDLFNYRFLQGWVFDARGHIEPFLAMGGALIDGIWIGEEGANHHHHIYWRLDFDVGNPGEDVFQAFKRGGDTVWDIGFSSFITDGVRPSCRPLGEVSGAAWCDVRTESGVLYDQRTGDRWRVVDPRDLNSQGNGKSFEFAVHSDGPADHFSTFDAMVLQYKGDSLEIGYEVPTSPRLGDEAAGRYTLLPETITDPVVWVAQHVHHDTRDEDRGSMSHHYAGFDIRPRNFVDENPGEPTYP